MKTTYLCAECLLRQACEACDSAFDNWDERYETIDWVINKLQNSFHDAVPEMLANEIHQMVKSASGVDPYKPLKDETNALFRSLAEEVRPELHCLKDKVKLAILVNAIDAAVPLEAHVDTMGYFSEPLSEGLQQELAIDEFANEAKRNLANEYTKKT